MVANIFHTNDLILSYFSYKECDIFIIILVLIILLFGLHRNT